MATGATLADTVCAVLRERGVKRLFGIPGGGSSLDLIAAAGRAGIDFVLVRTEAAGAIMAAVSGELTGVPGVMLVGVGPGAASAVNGVAYASLERAPMLLFSDGPAASLHQAFDQQALFEPVSKLQTQLKPDQGRARIAALLACAEALPRGPVHIDLTSADAAMPISGDGPAPAAGSPVTFEPGDLTDARALLAACRKPVIVAGMEARYGGAEAALGELARALAAPVLLTYKAKGCLADDDPLMAGLFTNASAEAAILGRADAVVLYGFDPIEMIPGPWRSEAPVLDLFPGPKPAGPVTPAARLTGPLTAAVAALVPELMPKLGPGVAPSMWQAEEIAALKADLRARVAIAGGGHTAESVITAVAAAAPAGCRLTVDAGSHMFAAMALWPAARPNDVLKSSGLSTMGYALPAAIASALETPDRPVVAFTGDGGLMMCLGELTTAVERGLDIVVVVCNDAALSLIDVKQQQRQHAARGVRYPAVDFAAAAKALGCRAWRVEPDDDLAPVLAAAFAGGSGGPALVDIRIDAAGYEAQLTALRG